eukprot:366251-Chlamydomonas_euryale.AAC.10
MTAHTLPASPLLSSRRYFALTAAAAAAAAAASAPGLEPVDAGETRRCSARGDVFGAGHPLLNITSGCVAWMLSGRGSPCICIAAAEGYPCP